MTPAQKRGWRLGLIIVFFSGVILVVLGTLNDNLLFFMPPSEILARKPLAPVRLGGIVEKGSLKRNEKTLLTTFSITDGKKKIEVEYRGITPDLFREEQGVVAEGILLPEGIFKATRLLARHDENYMPREVAQALKRSGDSSLARKNCQ